MSVVEPQGSGKSSEVSAGFLLARLGRGATELFHDAARRSGLKPAHIGVLMELRAQPVAQQALGEATGMDAVKLVGILNDLEATGLIERRRDCLDRRRHIVALTAAGRGRVVEVERESALAEERLLAGLSASQREQLAALLALVAETTRLAPRGCPEAEEPEAATGSCADAAED